jgi:hypothetical protein
VALLKEVCINERSTPIKPKSWRRWAQDAMGAHNGELDLVWEVSEVFLAQVVCDLRRYQK